jgi:predicted ATPase
VALLVGALGLGKAEQAALEATVDRHRLPRAADRLPQAHLHAPDPTPVTSFVGRVEELAQVQHLLASARLVTLTGPPGVGKTRLALAAAARLGKAFADGVTFVPLATVRQPRLVVPPIARALGVQETTGQTLLAGLRESLRYKRLLLVLDNFEQVRSAASLVVDLLEHAPGLTVLITSRAVLHVRGEHVVPVPPLALPDSERLQAADLLHYEAVRLFVERAQEAQVTFVVTDAFALGKICRRLDGLPLAIELAAARVRLLPLPALLARLERRLPLLTGGAQDLPMRQQTLRNALDWSYDLLEPGGQVLFRYLGAFAGGTTVEGITRAGSDDPGDTLEHLSELVDNSLLRQAAQPDGEPRFWMLESIREYALELLERSGEADPIRQRHARYYLNFAEAASRVIQEGTPDERRRRLDQLEAEHENLRAALRRFLQREEVEASLRLASALVPFWFQRNHWTEGRGWLDQALALPGVETFPHHRAMALLGAGALAQRQGDLAAGRPLLASSVALFRELGDRLGLARALAYESATLGMARDAAALLLAEESLALWRELGDHRGIAAQLVDMGYLATYRGEFATARALLNESRALWQGMGNQHGLAGVLHQLGQAALVEGNSAEARTWLEQSLALSSNLDNRGLKAQTLNRLGELAMQDGDDARAQACFEETLAIFRELGTLDGLAWSLCDLGRLAQRRGDVPGASSLLRESLRLRRQQGHTAGVLAALFDLAQCARLATQPVRATRLLGAVEARRHVGNLLIADAHQADSDRLAATLQATLGREHFAAIWAEGQALSLDQAVASALAEDT